MILTDTVCLVTESPAVGADAHGRTAMHVERYAAIFATAADDCRDDEYFAVSSAGALHNVA